MVAHFVSPLEVLQPQRVDMGRDKTFETVVEEVDILESANLVQVRCGGPRLNAFEACSERENVPLS